MGKLWTRLKLNDVGAGSQSVLSTRLGKNRALCSLLNWEMVKKSPPAELGRYHIRGRGRGRGFISPDLSLIR